MSRAMTTYELEDAWQELNECEKTGVKPERLRQLLEHISVLDGALGSMLEKWNQLREEVYRYEAQLMIIEYNSEGGLGSVTAPYLTGTGEGDNYKYDIPVDEIRRHLQDKTHGLATIEPWVNKT